MEVLYEDNHIIIVNKNCSEIVQGDKTGDKPLSEIVKEWIKEKYAKPGNVFIGVTHRLDRPVSGVVVFAKTSKALSRLNEMFRVGDVKKTYWAIVKNSPPFESQTLKHYIYRNEKLNKSVAYDYPKNGAKEAELSYKLLVKSVNYNLLHVNLKTGRHHQIRCQLSKIGCPIKGDLKYGAERSNANGGISLHARSIEFIHPVSKKQISVTAPVPADDKLWLDMEQSAINL
ncbi:MAG: RluA family pseudouridine synthase [Bacteroidaceae bacterium]|nr:RluA family pseudouridine synthase [Bacteroidaceae bacterium]